MKYPGYAGAVALREGGPRRCALHSQSRGAGFPVCSAVNRKKCPVCEPGEELRLTLPAGACCHAPFMIPILIGIGTFLLIIVALALILVVLAQRAKSDGGMAAMGGGMMESTFGPDTSNVLSKFTIRATIAFFVISFLLYLGYKRLQSHGSKGEGSLPNITAPAALPSLPAGGPAPAAAKPAAPSVLIPVAPAAKPAAATTAPDASAKAAQSGAGTKAP